MQHSWSMYKNDSVSCNSEVLISPIISSDIWLCQNNNLNTLCLFLFISPAICVSFMCVPRPEECARPFPLHPCLVSPDAELAFLRCVARILLLCLLPQKDAKSHTLRCCLTEVITTKGTLCVCVCERARSCPVIVIKTYTKLWWGEKEMDKSWNQ